MTPNQQTIRQWMDYSFYLAEKNYGTENFIETSFMTMPDIIFAYAETIRQEYKQEKTKPHKQLEPIHIKDAILRIYRAISIGKKTLLYRLTNKTMTLNKIYTTQQLWDFYFPDFDKPIDPFTLKNERMPDSIPDVFRQQFNLKLETDPNVGKFKSPKDSP